MTVTYSRDVTNAGIGVFLKLLTRWRGSIYKIVWVELLVYLIIYYLLNIIYLYCLGDPGKKTFLEIVTYFSKYGRSIPLSFVLGFYVSIIYNRWWSQFCTIPYPDNIGILVGASVSGHEDKPRMIRRTIIRQVCAAFTITLTMICPKVKKRFPTYNHFVQAGLLNAQEKKLIEELDKEYPSYKKYWLTLAWAANVAERARSEGFIKDEMGLKDILEEINEFREKCKKLCDYDWVCVPLVYTQVVTLAVYLYFLFTVIGTQFVEEQADGDISIFKFPLMSCVEFFFYMGWLKVAERLINPFGDDDDDFEVNWMIDRHLQVGYLLVDKIHNEHPKLTKDPHWEEKAPHHLLPYTVATQKYMHEHPVESTHDINVKQSDQDLVFEDDVGKSENNLAAGLFNQGKPLRKMFAGKRNSDTEHQLRRVTLKKDMDETEWDEFNLFEEETIHHPEISGEDVVNTEDFDALRQERLDKRKEALLKCLELLKDDKEEARKLLDEIIK